MYDQKLDILYFPFNFTALRDTLFIKIIMKNYGLKVYTSIYNYTLYT